MPHHEPPQSGRRWILLVQLATLLTCALLLGQLAWNFPFPAPVVRPFLNPKERWPEQQIREWAKTSEFRGDYWEFFTRDPERTIPGGDNIVAPSDGLFRYHDLVEERQYLVIAMSFWDVHIQRAPCDAVVTEIRDAGTEYRDGEGTNMAYLNEKLCPVQKILTLDTEHGRFGVRLITSLSARRLEVFVKAGETIKKGQKIGRILAGSTVVFDLPRSMPITHKIGERFVGGETVLVPVAALNSHLPRRK